MHVFYWSIVCECGTELFEQTALLKIMHGIVHPQFMCAGNRTLFECLSEIYVFEPSTAPRCLLVIKNVSAPIA
jgi:hypothetical protein